MRVWGRRWHWGVEASGLGPVCRRGEAWVSVAVCAVSARGHRSTPMLWGDGGQSGLVPAAPQMCEVLAQHQPQPGAALCLGRTAHTRRKECPGVRGQGSRQRQGVRDREEDIGWALVGGVRGRGQAMLAVTGWGEMGRWKRSRWPGACVNGQRGWGLDGAGRVWMEGGGAWV